MSVRVLSSHSVPSKSLNHNTNQGITPALRRQRLDLCEASLVYMVYLKRGLVLGERNTIGSQLDPLAEIHTKTKSKNN